ncbi:MAG: GntR family transcriptional regulator [Nocardioidaceae bacterium]
MSHDRVKPLERVPTSTLIADQLREAIMSGDFVQGEQVGEAHLAEQLGVSRGPLREAMQRLVQEGLLDSIPHRGLFVVTLSEDDIRDIYTARLAVETAAVLEIMRHTDMAASTKRLDRAVERLSSAAARGPTTALSNADADFHEMLVSESGSARLQRMATTLLVETRMCMAALADTYVVPDDLAHEHGVIVDAIRAGDREAAIEVMRAHMHDSVARLVPTPALD